MLLDSGSLLLHIGMHCHRCSVRRQSVWQSPCCASNVILLVEPRREGTLATDRVQMFQALTGQPRRRRKAVMAGGAAHCIFVLYMSRSLVRSKTAPEGFTRLDLSSFAGWPRSSPEGLPSPLLHPAHCSAQAYRTAAPRLPQAGAPEPISWELM